jgi:hypothetical protein
MWIVVAVQIFGRLVVSVGLLWIVKFGGSWVSLKFLRFVLWIVIL